MPDLRSFTEKILGNTDFLIGVELITTRGTMEQVAATRTRRFASDLVLCDQVDWVSITDNAGGNPMLAPTSLGRPVLYAGKEVVIHLSCKDYNRHGLESQAWHLASEGFHNILALSGDYPAQGYQGQAKPVFDIDSVGLLALLDQMNRGLGNRPKAKGLPHNAAVGTNFFCGAVATNFKRHENEVLPQLLKMEKKLRSGARFIIAQVGYDSRKSHEMLCYLRAQGFNDVPLIGNVFVLTLPIARFFHSGKIPGVVVSEQLLAECQRHGSGPDKGRKFFRELAARQIAVFRGLGFRGAYLGGVHDIDSINEILEIERSFGPDDWLEFARQIRFSRPGEFFLYGEDACTGLADPDQPHPAYCADDRRANHNVTWGYRISRLMHEQIFVSGKPLYRFGRWIYNRSSNPQRGPLALRVLEHASKSALFGCQDCGDCSLPDIAYLCPESQCAKNQRNGPCGGTRDGKCEVHDFECIWSRAYDRLKWEGRQRDLLQHAPVIQDETLRGTSSWSNLFLGSDHHGKKSSSAKANQDGTDGKK